LKEFENNSLSDDEEVIGGMNLYICMHAYASVRTQFDSFVLLYTDINIFIYIYWVDP